MVSSELSCGADPMKILIDSFEYRCWHEVGHATVCLHLGGDVELIEFLEGDARGHARTRCVVTPGIEKNVVCGGFAAEFYLLKSNYAERANGDYRDVSQIVFHNATGDREDFWERKLAGDEMFSTAEDEKFMNHAIGSVVPIIEQYFPKMQKLVRVLCDASRVEGSRVKAILRPSNS